MYRELPHTSFYNRVNFDRTKGISNINCACRMVLSMSTKKLAKYGLLFCLHCRSLLWVTLRLLSMFYLMLHYRELGLLRKRRQATENKAFIVCSKYVSGTNHTHSRHFNLGLFIWLFLFFQIKYSHTWLWLTLSPRAGERKTIMAKK